MIDPGDRLLEYALHEVLGGDGADARDLSGAVRREWERGERRELSPLERRRIEAEAAAALYVESESRPRASTRSPSLGPRTAAAAAALLAAAGVLAYLARSRPEAPDPLSNSEFIARADTALWVDGVPGASIELDRGDLARTPRGQGALVALANGGRLRADPGTAFRVDGPSSFALLEGTLGVEAGPAALTITLPGDVELAVDADGEARVDVVTERGIGVIDVAAKPGDARLAGPSGTALPLDAEADRATLLLGVAGVRLASPTERVVPEELRALADEGLPPGIHLEMLNVAYLEGVLATLREQPELWPLAREAARDVLDSAATPKYVRSDLIGSFSIDPSPFAAEVLRTAWLDDPAAFPVDAIVALAERGIPEFEREVDAWLEAWDPSSEDDPFSVALVLALAGDQAAAPFLRTAIADAPKDEFTFVPLLAAAGLSRLGVSRAWDEISGPFVEETRALLDADELELAAQRVNVLAYALALRDQRPLAGIGFSTEANRRPPVAYPWHWIRLYGESRADEARARDDLVRELETLATR
ncbi:MAG: hypothetical protein AAGA20_19560 [Planctomycetota bacterium]